MVPYGHENVRSNGHEYSTAGRKELPMAVYVRHDEYYR